MKRVIILLLTVILVISSGCGIEAERVKIINVPLTQESYAFAIAKENNEIKNAVNAYLNEITENGELEAIINSFFNGKADFAHVNPKSKEGCLVVATNAYFPPFEYYNGNKLTGIDIYLANEIAKTLGKSLYVEDMDFSAVIPSVQKGNCDIGMAGLTINEDRRRLVDFSMEYYQSSQVLVVRESNCEFDQSFSNLEIEAILATKRSSYKIGAQSGTTGYMYIRGDSGFGYKGFARIDVIAFTTAALAIRDLSNGKIDAVILDYQPALEIVKAINTNK
ncbi:MAG: transporter substrate-binding domain-containing protein [Clostridiales bacterium]|nr:transporter substrate-binding domain-containing protein [Clostridiales bacterium]